ncbi:sortilin-related receptor-like [Dendronephthya gigantea]|uniref:sortilin-related receptor-like n=1 Tax=Dendronephthya gigantea TaxID=151771 RepID=UPI00106D85B3|nr:sortilin-related receptor-like [Dendronephthya gigantea]
MIQTFLVALFLLASLGETLIQGKDTNVRTKHLFVQRKVPLRGGPLPHREIYLSEDDNGSGKEVPEDGRSRRSVRKRRSTSKVPTKSLYEFNDSHYMLYVGWSGFNVSDTVVVLSRDINPKADSTSYLYISNNYGKTYNNMSHLLKFTKDGVKKYAVIEKFYNSPLKPKWYIFADTTNNLLFVSKDDCKTLKEVKLGFKPSDITFHNSRTGGLIAYDSSTEKIHYSSNFGSSWLVRKEKIRSYFWGMADLDSDEVIYMELKNDYGTSDILRGHWNHDLTSDMIMRNVTDFEISDIYMFATKKSKNGLDLYVAYHYHDFRKAEFPNTLRTEDFLIADTSEKQVFVAVNHNSNTSHLYISDMTGVKYTLSLERILFYSPDRQKDHWLRRYMTESFVDLYPVASMRGVYLASQLSYGKVGTRAIYTVISHDKGRFWRKLSVPVRHANGSQVNCSSWDQCSLHLAQHYAQRHPRYYAPSIMSKPSAPGLILSSGNIGKSLTYASNLYVSNDAGRSWLEVLEDRWWFNFGDHGGVIVAVRQWSATRELLYSTDEGLTWKRYNFTDQHVHVYGLLTEPGENTTIFTIFGSYHGHHSWLVVQVDVKNVLGRPCTKSDYETWSPYHRGHGHGCILGQRLEFERRRRSSTCYNGKNYDRPINTTICPCRGQDYECDRGFKSYWGFLCLRDSSSGFDPYAPPRPCPPGHTYNRTQGYRKISGDKCSVSYTKWWYEPYETSCPIKVDSAFLLYAERTKIQYMDLVNSSRSTAVEGLRAAVAVAYDKKENYIYWADMKDHKIFRRKLDGDSADMTIAGVKQVEGLDFDWTTDNLYWVDAGKKVIEVCRKDGRYRKTVHSDDLDRPRALALDPPYGQMFWTDWGSTAKIEMSDMDGKNRRILVDKDLVWPNGLAIDIYNPKSSRNLYYTDAYKDIIGQYDLITNTSKILASRSSHTDNFKWISILKHPYSIAVDDQYVYWDDWQTGNVYQIHKSFKGKPSTLIKKAVGMPSKSRYEIKVYYNSSQVAKSSCSGIKCSQLCFPKPNNQYACECGDDFEPDSKTKECRCKGGLITMKNGTCYKPSGKSCAPDEFLCKNNFCIPMNMRCDWNNDCGDLSDEEGCGGQSICNNNKTLFACPGGRCIPRDNLCDGEKDCQDGADENICKNRTACPIPSDFRCKNGQCVDQTAKCNGDYDCQDHSDEKNCPHHYKGCKNPSDFMCEDKSMCIVGKARCNGYPNCPDKSDEINCVHSCHDVKNLYLCQDGSKCISIKLKCNGKEDCIDGSDEWCGTTPGTSTRKVAPVAHAQSSDSHSTKKTLMWAIPVGVVFAVLVISLVYFVVKSRRLHRSFYRLVRSDSFDRGITYHNVEEDDDDTPLLQGFSDDDPLVEA